MKLNWNVTAEIDNEKFHFDGRIVAEALPMNV